jgi:RNA polymerase sigma-70 factor, ECF subfamily
MYATAEMPAFMDLNFAEIYREHHRRVFNLCAYLLNSRDLAEDASHEVFLRVQRRIETYNPSLPFSNWISKIACNYCLDILRRRGTEKRLFTVDASDVLDFKSNRPSPLNEMIVSEQGKNIRDALGALPDKYRVPLVLAYYNELNYNEIADALQIPRNTVATLLLRGKRLLREKLNKERHHEMPK